MQKLRPYIMPGLLLFHLMLLCVMIFIAPEVGDKEFSLVDVTVLSMVFSSLFLTALWAGLGSEPWALRIPGCGALAALYWVGFRILLERMSLPLGGDELVVFPPVAWVVLVGLLLCLRVIPFLKWRIVLNPSPSEAADSRPLTYSLTHGILIVVATWGGVFVLLKDSHLWSTFELRTLEQTATALEMCWFAAITGAVLLPVTRLCVGLTLTRLADWMFYRRRWTLPLLVAVVLGAAIITLFRVGPPPESLAELLRSIFLLSLILVVQPTAALLLMGNSGYRLAPRSKPPEAASGNLSGLSSKSAEVSPVGGLPSGLRGAHVAALAALLVLFCALVPTGVLRHHKITMSFRMISEHDTNDAGEITSLALRPFVTNAQLVYLKGLTNLQTLSLYGTRITDAGLVHLEGLTNLQTLSLDYTQINDAGLVHLKGLTNLQELSLRNTQTSDAGLVHLKGLTSLKKLFLRSTRITDMELLHLKGLTNLEYLRLENTRVTDTGLAHLEELTNLKSLSLDGTWGVTDDGLLRLKGLTNLQALNLGTTAITDAGLVHLKGLTMLEKLSLDHTQVTDAGVAELHKALPECEIDH
ncbi:MAG: hypothetical protein CMJ81_04795 [Planctomycetaceae bacterium]|nr:hypothetical protein [Planctomycetaceae bacterium]